MFAFALWDKHERTLYIARDRAGEKPLYYGHHEKLIVFGSEIKALIAHPNFSPVIDREAVCSFFRHGYIPEPRSIYRNVCKLPPGCYARLGQTVEAVSYWSPASGPGQTSSAAEAVDAIDGALSTAVGSQLQADVPVGAFLSGGVDSSLVAALMQEQSTTRAKTFSIGFSDSAFNEAPFAKLVADYIGTEHHELYVGDAEALSVIPDLPKLYDEPFADSSQIPTYLLSKLARSQIKVALSGDGADELFGGYSRYNFTSTLWKRFNAFPLYARKQMPGFSALLNIVPENFLNGVFAPAKLLFRDTFGNVNIAAKLKTLLSLAGLKDYNSLYYHLISLWKDPRLLVLNTNDNYSILEHLQSLPKTLSKEEIIMCLDFVSYLPGDILTKVDRASMGASLEVRTPFLDYRVIEASFKMPYNFKVQNGIQKQCIRDVLYRRVPKKLIDRPKKGFGVPINKWLRGPLRDWAQDLLNDKRIKSAGYLNAKIISQILREHLSGKRDWGHHLWAVLMFESWRESAKI